MKVYQILVTLAYGDGVGNDVMAIYQILKKHGYQTAIYAQNIDSRIKCENLHTVFRMPEFEDDDIIIYHLSTGTEITDEYAGWNGKKLIIYHNITPPQWFDGLDENGLRLCRQGIDQARRLAPDVKYAIADSEFNKQDLIDMGYTCPIDVLPIIIPFEDYKQEPDYDLIDKYDDDYVNIMFAGRIAPNKMQPDVVKAFAEYQKKYNKKSRLFLVGSYFPDSAFYKKVVDAVEETGAENVIFSGHIPFKQILSYYHAADLFLCMSEHEGFCIPLLEAMQFDLPVVAYNSTAVPGTLGSGGVVFDEKNYPKVASIINDIMTDNSYREEIIKKQQNRLKDFEYENIEKEFLRLLERFQEAN